MKNIRQVFYVRGNFFWFEHIKFGDFTFNDYGDYYYKSNLTVYDDNNNLLSSYDFDLTIQYVHKIFGSDEYEMSKMWLRSEAELQVLF